MPGKGAHLLKCIPPFILLLASFATLFVRRTCEYKGKPLAYNSVSSFFGPGTFLAWIAASIESMWNNEFKVLLSLLIHGPETTNELRDSIPQKFSAVDLVVISYPVVTICALYFRHDAYGDPMIEVASFVWAAYSTLTILGLLPSLLVLSPPIQEPDFGRVERVALQYICPILNVIVAFVKLLSGSATWYYGLPLFTLWITAISTVYESTTLRPLFTSAAMLGSSLNTLLHQSEMQTCKFQASLPSPPTAHNILDLDQCAALVISLSCLVAIPGKGLLLLLLRLFRNSGFYRDMYEDVSRITYSRTVLEDSQRHE